jgi:hypothetical protein
MNKVINYLSALDEKRHEDAQNIVADINDLDIYLCLSGMNDEVLREVPDWQWFELIKLAKGWGIISYILLRALNKPVWEELLEAAFYQAMKIKEYAFACNLLHMMPCDVDKTKIDPDAVIRSNMHIAINRQPQRMFPFSCGG